MNVGEFLKDTSGSESISRLAPLLWMVVTVAAAATGLAQHGTLPSFDPSWLQIGAGVFTAYGYTKTRELKSADVQTIQETGKEPADA